MKIDRYNIEAVNNGGDLSTESHKSSDGAWVRYEDHAAALRAERERHDTPAKPAASTPIEEMDALHDQATRIIEKIRHNYSTFGKQWSMNDEPLIRLRCAIATAIDNAVRTERAKLEKFAAFAGPDGEPRKVLGTLPVTADGCIAGLGSVLWNPLFGPEAVPLHVHKTTVWGECRENTGPVVGAALADGRKAWYSTKQAAEAAAGRKK